MSLAQRRWRKAEFSSDPSATAETAAEVFSFFDGQSTGDLRLHLAGTSFQLKVWEALLQVPSGMLVSYEDIAVQVGLPAAARAVLELAAHDLRAPGG